MDDEPKLEGVVEEAKDFLRQVMDAETEIRSEALEDLRFRFGEQWPAEMRAQRSIPGQQRPMLTINETDSYCRQVINQMRQQRPRGKAHPLNNTSDKKIAEIFTGVGRHIEANSDAPNAYDLGADFQVSSGVGYWRVMTDWVSPKSRNQDIYVRQIDNPFSVYFDQFSTLPDGSDAKKCLITDFINRESFKKMYPGANPGDWSLVGDGDGEPDWSTKDAVRIAEYYHIEETPKRLVYLSSGLDVWEDQMMPPELMRQMGITILGDRMSSRNQVKWCKVSGFDKLEERNVPGQWIPVIPCYGVNIIIDGKRKRFGMVRFARDPQMMVNYWKTSLTEVLAMAPKAKWQMAEGQQEGHENEYAQANNSANPILLYKSTDIEGTPAPVPQRISPEPVPAGLVEAIGLASQDLQRVLGMFDPAQIRSQEQRSGKAVQAEAGQAEMGNYHFYDNQCRSIKHTWRIFFDYFPTVYDTKRTLRVIGYDGTAELVTVNDKQEVQGVTQILNNVKDAEMGIELETGPGYNTKRQEGVAALMNLLNTALGEEVAKTCGDIILRAIDAPFMNEAADRLAANNPLAQIDKKSDVPPAAQMQIKALEQQLQQAMAHLQQMQAELKLRGGIEGMKQAAETHRTQLKIDQEQKSDVMWVAEERAQVESVERTRMHDTQIKANTAAHDTVIKTETQKEIEALKAHIALVLAKLDKTAEDGAAEETEERAI